MSLVYDDIPSMPVYQRHTRDIPETYRDIPETYQRHTDTRDILETYQRHTDINPKPGMSLVCLVYQRHTRDTGRNTGRVYQRHLGFRV